jgi:hypothetical protein
MHYVIKTKVHGWVLHLSVPLISLIKELDCKFQFLVNLYATANGFRPCQQICREGRTSKDSILTVHREFMARHVVHGKYPNTDVLSVLAKWRPSFLRRKNPIKLTVHDAPGRQELIDNKAITSSCMAL